MKEHRRGEEVVVSDVMYSVQDHSWGGGLVAKGRKGVEGSTWPDQFAEAGDCFVCFPVLGVDFTRRQGREEDARPTGPMALMPFVLEVP